jgi:hypothetical protein
MILAIFKDFNGKRRYKFEYLHRNLVAILLTSKAGTDVLKNTGQIRGKIRDKIRGKIRGKYGAKYGAKYGNKNDVLQTDDFNK